MEQDVIWFSDIADRLEGPRHFGIRGMRYHGTKELFLFGPDTRPGVCAQGGFNREAGTYKNGKIRNDYCSKPKYDECNAQYSREDKFKIPTKWKVRNSNLNVCVMSSHFNARRACILPPFTDLSMFSRFQFPIPSSRAAVWTKSTCLGTSGATWSFGKSSRATREQLAQLQTSPSFSQMSLSALASSYGIKSTVPPSWRIRIPLKMGGARRWVLWHFLSLSC